MNIEAIVESLDAAIAATRVELAQMTTARDNLAALRPSSNGTSKPLRGVKNWSVGAFGVKPKQSTRPPHPMKGKKLSPKVRENMRKAQTARFAKQGKTEAKPAVKRAKRNLTPEGRKRIAEAVKRRWSVQNAAKKAAA